MCITTNGECLLKFRADENANNTCIKNIDDDMQLDSVYADVSVDFDPAVASMTDNYPELRDRGRVSRNVRPPEATSVFPFISKRAVMTVASLFGRYLPNDEGTVSSEATAFDLSTELLIDDTLTDYEGNIYVGRPERSVFIDAITGLCAPGFQGCMALASLSDTVAIAASV